MIMPTDAKCCLIYMPRLCPTLNNYYFILIHFPVPEICAYVSRVPTRAQEKIHTYMTLISLQEKMLEDSALYEISMLPHKCT